MCSLFVVRNIPFRDQVPGDGERLLIEEHASPVGYKVPKLPDYEIDPTLARQGNSCFSVKVQFLCGVLFALVMGVVMALFGSSNWPEVVYDTVNEYVLRN